MKLKNDKLALIDIGNSRFKFYFNNLLTSYFYNEPWQSEFKLYLQNLVALPDLVLISSVNTNVEKDIMNTLYSYSIPAIGSKELLKEQAIIDFSAISGMGSDRKLGLLGALTYYEPPFITVDCGTALTINVLGINYQCLGGVIFADIYTQIKTLSQKTADLDEVELYFEKNNLGKNTEQALRIGIVNSVVFGIRGIVEEIIKNEFSNKKIPIILTGGSAQIIAEGLREWKNSIEIRENLVLEGLSYLYSK